MVQDSVQRATVRLKGMRPLLMSSPAEIFDSQSKSKTRKSSQDYDDVEEAEKRAYRDKEGFLYVPARCIFACLVKASKLYKTRSKGISFTDMLKGSISIAPEEIRLIDSKGKPVKDYEIDRSLVVVQRARILRCRPLIKDWELEFQVAWNQKIYGLTADQVKQVVNEAGFIGLLDWRPRFGIFELESFKVSK